MKANTNYNRSEIMRKAWADYKFYRNVPSPRQHDYVKYNGKEYTKKTAPFGHFLHFAWFCAKKDAEEAEKEARERAKRLETRKKFKDGASFEGYWFKLWEKADMRRIYINGYRAGGYIDAISGEIHAMGDSRALAERFLEQYII